MSTADSSDKTIKGILTKLGLIMGFILIVPGIMSNVLEIDPIDGCIQVTQRDADSAKPPVVDDNTTTTGTQPTGIEKDKCWRDVNPGTDKLTKAKVAFDRDVIGLISWALTAFILIMVVVGFVFPGRDIISYMRSNKEEP